ncbi:argininosuccinate synthase [candidate division KSB1 bacterium]|nr:MAG: argininosuccinate synthase [candidate division KSB1 bacterium]
MKKVILAYSGGLDTSVILKWLVEKKYKVIAFIADVGQNEDLGHIYDKALKTGAVDAFVEDLKEELVSNYVFPAIKANSVYEGRYLLGTSLARPLIAKRQIEIAKMLNAEYVAHGATGKGNDQVRFELSYYALDPTIKVISPWKDEEFLKQFKGRPDMIRYAEQHGIEVKAGREKPFSEDANLIHISHESGILEDPAVRPMENVFSMTKSPMDAPDKETLIDIHFKDGIPVKVIDHSSKITKETPYDIFSYLNKVGSENGVGRVDIVENRFVGIKSRGVYESPGMSILLLAHMDIEGIAMDREVMRLRDMLTPKFAEIVYNGFWFSPEMNFLMAAINKSQEAIDGVVKLSLYKGNIIIIGRESPCSLYDKDLSSMDIEGGFNQQDSRGFININAIRLKAHNAIMTKQGKLVSDFLEKKI